MVGYVQIYDKGYVDMINPIISEMVISAECRYCDQRLFKPRLVTFSRYFLIIFFLEGFAVFWMRGGGGIQYFSFFWA